MNNLELTKSYQLVLANGNPDRGLRQGCPPSPLQFALLIAKIPEGLNKEKGGVTMKNRRMRCLLYADDIVLLNETMEDTTTQLGTLLQEVEDRHLEINWSKSSIMVPVEDKNTLNTTTEREWRIYRSDIEQKPENIDT